MVLSLALCGCNKKKSGDAVLDVDQLTGTWKNIEFVQLPVITFNKDGTYVMKFLRNNLDFSGNYSVSGNMLHVIAAIISQGNHQGLAFAACRFPPWCIRAIGTGRGWRRGCGPSHGR